jgi:polysaccharide biosynthesis protein PslG
MFSRSPRGLVLLGLCLLTLCITVLWAFAAGDRTTGAEQTPQPVATRTSITVLATATVPTAVRHAVSKSTAAAVKPSATPSSSAATITPSPADIYGISDPVLLNQSASVQVEQLKAMKAVGISSVRLDASWYWGQPSGPSSYAWSAMDQVIASIKKVGLSVDLIIDGCPPWAAVSGAQGDQFAQPESSAAFATWAAAVAARYGPRGVQYFEIWNEPNLVAFWQPKPDPTAYTADLKSAYTAIKEVDPSAVVISGGLAPAENDGTDYDPRTFLEDMYADGARGSFDELGYHPYSYPAPPDTVEPWSGWSMMSDTSPSIRSIMTENGDSSKKIWITEYGAPTSGPDSVGEAAQSTDLVQAISQVRELDWIGSFYIYTWSDVSTLPPDEDGFGLLTDDNAQKPAYTAVTAALATTG